MNLRELFLRHVAQTSPAPLALHIEKAEGCLLWDADGKSYIDLIGGISVATTGHRHPHVVGAIQKQLDQYLHVMVYGEFVQSPQVQYAELLTSHLPPQLHAVYFTNSGAEAVEGAMKLAKRVSGRMEFAAFNDSYHGSTQGALSVMGNEYWRGAYRPLLPGIHHLQYGSFEDLGRITQRTAGVIVETVQAEAGVKAPSKEWLKALRQRCTETGALLMFDEIQAGFGRTGTLWGFEGFGIEPDVLLLGKALGGGLPLGAFITSKEKVDVFTEGPVLGHITTFGGHPLCCAAGKAALEVLINENLIEGVVAKRDLFLQLLNHPLIMGLHHHGLWIAVELEDFPTCKAVIDRCIDKGLITDWFLFASNCLRISPPLVISEAEIRQSCAIIVEAMDEVAA